MNHTYKNKVKVIAFVTATGSLDKLDRIEADQLRTLTSFAHKHNLQIVDTVYRAGVNEVHCIDKVKRIFQRIHKGEADAILIFNLREITRDITKAAMLIGDVTKAKGSIVSVKNGLLRINLENFGGDPDEK